MIYNLIGSGILVAVGAGGMWLWMRSGEVEFDPDLHPDCTNCGDSGWVCEDHPDTAWYGLAGAVECCGGAGAPCPCCEWELATTGIRDAADRAHSCLSDAHNSTKERIERALEQVTPGANATVKRMAAILTGERA